MQNHSARIVSGIAAAALFILMSGVASAQSVAFTNEFGVGAQGSNVTNLQTWLTDNGYYSGPITGYYGSLTMAAVERYQSANGISATGYVGPLTLASLNAKASGSTTISSNSGEIAQLEAQLNALLAEIQTLENQTTTPTGASVSLQTNENVSAGATLTASGTGPFTYTISSSPLNGTLTSFNSSTGAFIYTPHNNYAGTDTFSYTVSNSTGVSAPMTITINVEPNSTTSSTLPSGQTMSFATANGAALNGTLTASSGTGPFTYALVNSPAHGSLTSFNTSTGTFTYIPTSGYTGSDSFTYTVSNGSATSTTNTVNITD